MFKSRFEERNNICGIFIAKLRIRSGFSQRELAEKMQLIGIDFDKNVIQRIETGKRFVTDIELLAFSQVFGVSADSFLQT